MRCARVPIGVPALLLVMAAAVACSPAPSPQSSAPRPADRVSAAVEAGSTPTPSAVTAADGTDQTVEVTFINLKVILDLNSAQESTAAVDVCVDEEPAPIWGAVDPGESAGPVDLAKAQHTLVAYPSENGKSCADLAATVNPLASGTFDLTSAPAGVIVTLWPYRPARTESDFECPQPAGQDGVPVSGQASCAEPNFYVLSTRDVPDCPSNPVTENLSDLRSTVKVTSGVEFEGGSSEVVGDLDPTAISGPDGVTISSFGISSNLDGPTRIAQRFTFPDETGLGPVDQAPFTHEFGGSTTLTLFFGGSRSPLGSPVPAGAETQFGVAVLTVACPDETSTSTPPPGPETTAPPPPPPAPQVADTSETSGAATTGGAAPISLAG